MRTRPDSSQIKPSRIAIKHTHMTNLEKAQQLYTRAYSRWCFELSHEKNHITAKDICISICNEVLGDMGADRGYEFWAEVRSVIQESNHTQLYKP